MSRRTKVGQPIVYVAGPMTGLPQFNYPAFFEAELRLVRAGFMVRNPARVEAENPTKGTPQPWEWYIRRTLRMLLECDGIALLPKWENSRGARLEVRVAKALKLDMRMLEDWLK